MKYRIHQVANLFPMMGEQSLNELASDIKENGLMDPIVVLGDEIVDGRSRLKACEIAGVTPRYREIATNNPVFYVISSNLHLRHLPAPQRAALAAELADMTVGNPTGANQHGGGIGSFDPIPEISIEEAAEKMNVTPEAVKRAKNRMKKNPQAHEAAKAGKKVKSMTSGAAGDSWRLVASDAYQEITGKKGSWVWIRNNIKPELEKYLSWFDPKDKRSVLSDEQKRDVRRVVFGYFERVSGEKTKCLETQAAESKESLAPTAQQKLDRAIAAHKRMLDAEFEERIKERIDDVLKMYSEEYARYKEFSDAYTGVFTQEEYRLLLSVLHPDRCQKDRASQFEKAFHTVKSKEEILCGAKKTDRPDTLPSSAAELMARRKIN